MYGLVVKLIWSNRGLVEVVRALEVETLFKKVGVWKIENVAVVILQD